MPTPGAGIHTIGIVYETNATDQTNAPSFGATVFSGFSLSFELSAADRGYSETTLFRGFGVEFEYSPLYVDEIYLRQG